MSPSRRPVFFPRDRGTTPRRADVASFWVRRSSEIKRTSYLILRSLLRFSGGTFCVRMPTSLNSFGRFFALIHSQPSSIGKSHMLEIGFKISHPTACALCVLARAYTLASCLDEIMMKLCQPQKGIKQRGIGMHLALDAHCIFWPVWPHVLVVAPCFLPQTLEPTATCSMDS